MLCLPPSLTLFTTMHIDIDRFLRNVPPRSLFPRHTSIVIRINFADSPRLSIRTKKPVRSPTSCSYINARRSPTRFYSHSKTPTRFSVVDHQRLPQTLSTWPNEPNGALWDTFSFFIVLTHGTFGRHQSRCTRKYILLISV